MLRRNSHQYEPRQRDKVLVLLPMFLQTRSLLMHYTCPLPFCPTHCRDVHIMARRVRRASGRLEMGRVVV